MSLAPLPTSTQTQTLTSPPTRSAEGRLDPATDVGLVVLVVRSTLRAVRHRLRDHLSAQGLDPDDACLLLSELVGNASAP
jgi:uncharacterized protein YciW